MIRRALILCVISLACLNAPRASAVSATGGTVTNYTLNGTNFTAHIFTNSGTFTVASGGSVEYLVVGGGGGAGGTYQGGGGGAGGLLTGTSTIGIGSYAITVGTGGRGANRIVGSALPSNGVNSSIQSVATAIGGGYGAQESLAAAVGGSGGGAAHYANPTGGAGTSGQGNRGGNRNSGTHGSGGGGAGGQGADNGNPGGPGVASSMSGSSVTYANGGNGQNRPASGSTNGSDGVANTGNGGNGGGGFSPAGMGGYGGSGIVIVRYVTGGSPSAAAPVRSFYGRNLAVLKWPNAAVKNQESAQ